MMARMPRLCTRHQTCSFSLAQVPATVLQAGVLRATVPPHAPGPVRLAVSLGDGVPRSRPLQFEYRLLPPALPSEDERCFSG